MRPWPPVVELSPWARRFGVGPALLPPPLPPPTLPPRPPSLLQPSPALPLGCSGGIGSNGKVLPLFVLSKADAGKEVAVTSPVRARSLSELRFDPAALAAAATPCEDDGGASVHSDAGREAAAVRAVSGGSPTTTASLPPDQASPGAQAAVATTAGAADNAGVPSWDLNRSLQRSASSQGGAPVATAATAVATPERHPLLVPPPPWLETVEAGSGGGRQRERVDLMNLWPLRGAGPFSLHSRAPGGGGAAGSGGGGNSEHSSERGSCPAGAPSVDERAGSASTAASPAAVAAAAAAAAAADWAGRVQFRLPFVSASAAGVTDNPLALPRGDAEAQSQAPSIPETATAAGDALRCEARAAPATVAVVGANVASFPAYQQQDLRQEPLAVGRGDALGMTAATIEQPLQLGLLGGPAGGIQRPPLLEVASTPRRHPRSDSAVPSASHGAGGSGREGSAGSFGAYTEADGPQAVPHGGFASPSRMGVAAISLFLSAGGMAVPHERGLSPLPDVAALASQILGGLAQAAHRAPVAMAALRRAAVSAHTASSSGAGCLNPCSPPRSSESLEHSESTSPNEVLPAMVTASADVAHWPMKHAGIVIRGGAVGVAGSGDYGGSLWEAQPAPGDAYGSKGGSVNGGGGGGGGGIGGGGLRWPALPPWFVPRLPPAPEPHRGTLLALPSSPASSSMPPPRFAPSSRRSSSTSGQMPPLPTPPLVQQPQPPPAGGALESWPTRRPSEVRFARRSPAAAAPTAKGTSARLEGGGAAAAAVAWGVPWQQLAVAHQQLPPHWVRHSAARRRKELVRTTRLLPSPPAPPQPAEVAAREAWLQRWLVPSPPAAAAAMSCGGPPLLEPGVFLTLPALPSAAYMDTITGS
eukprot:SM000211S06633  [mRNA]  locus=s211:233918:236983:+ [translate_table: standard]